MHRRLFLKTIPAVALAPSLFAQACSPDDPKPGIGKKVLVVGAGIAGIYATHLLLEKGFEVQILEASDRWGGRIRALDGFADFSIELGAEEVHGEKSEWYKWVKKTPGVQFVNTDDEDYYWYKGAMRTESQVRADAEGKKALDFVSSAGNYTGADKTVLQHAQSQNLAAQALPFVNAQIGNEFGTSNDRLSIKGIAEEGDRWTAGEQNFFLANRSFRQVIEAHFSASLDKIALNTVVKSVDHSDTKVRATDLNGTVWEADHLLLTVPLTVLRDGDIAFSPALPAEKTTAAQKIGMGAGMKVILKFKQPFWQANTGSVFGAGPVPEYWQTNAGRGSTPVLTALVMGEKAEQLSAMGAAAVQAVLADLDAMYSGAASAQFSDAHLMDWHKMPHIRGAYSFPIVGGGIGQREALAAPVGRKLFFAGEATNAGGHSGTVHGALETATRAVREIIG